MAQRRNSEKITHWPSRIISADTDRRLFAAERALDGVADPMQLFRPDLRYYVGDPGKCDRSNRIGLDVRRHSDFCGDLLLLAF